MPRSPHSQSNRRRPGQPTWLGTLYEDVARIIGQQLATQYQAPQDLPADIAALVVRMDEPQGTG
jgi:hypothetical protein